MPSTFKYWSRFPRELKLSILEHNEIKELETLLKVNKSLRELTIQNGLLPKGIDEMNLSPFFIGENEEEKELGFDLLVQGKNDSGTKCFTFTPHDFLETQTAVWQAVNRITFCNKVHIDSRIQQRHPTLLLMLERFKEAKIFSGLKHIRFLKVCGEIETAEMLFGNFNLTSVERVDLVLNPFNDNENQLEDLAYQLLQAPSLCNCAYLTLVIPGVDIWRIATQSNAYCIQIDLETLDLVKSFLPTILDSTGGRNPIGLFHIKAYLEERNDPESIFYELVDLVSLNETIDEENISDMYPPTPQENLANSLREHLNRLETRNPEFHQANRALWQEIDGLLLDAVLPQIVADPYKVFRRQGSGWCLVETFKTLRFSHPKIYEQYSQEMEPGERFEKFFIQTNGNKRRIISLLVETQATPGVPTVDISLVFSCYFQCVESTENVQ